MARPKVQLSDLPDNWKELALAKYEEGGADAEVKVAIAPGNSKAMSNDLFDRLMEEESEFSETIKEGRTLAEAWWAIAGRKGIYMGKDFNATTWIFNMKNRFAWQDKTEVKHLGGISINIDEDDAEL